MKGLHKRQTLKQPKLTQLDKVLYKWFTAMCSEGKPMTGPKIIEKGKCCHDEMIIVASAHSQRAGCKILKN
jgi:hypothetical protein